MTIQEQMASVPDSVKITLATGSTALTMFGITVQDWMYIGSAIVSILFIIEKTPIFLQRMKELYRWMRGYDSSK
jgi:hypothetical protein